MLSYDLFGSHIASGLLLLILSGGLLFLLRGYLTLFIRNFFHHDPLKDISMEEQEYRISKYQPSLIEPVYSSYQEDENKRRSSFQIESKNGYFMWVRGLPNFPYIVKCIDLLSFDYHCFSTNADIKEVSSKTINEYGVGSCGPRGFLGTMKQHILLESSLSDFLGVEETVVYSSSYGTTATLIPTFLSPGDYILADAHSSQGIVTGCALSRSHLVYYDHISVSSLESEIKKISMKKQEKDSHRYVVTEGIFANDGDICPLPDILRLCQTYKFHLILDDSHGFGVLGSTGRGTPDYFGIPTASIDFYIGTLGASLGSMGGFCCCAHDLASHQRLLTTGYVFSASLPPYLATAATRGLYWLTQEFVTPGGVSYKTPSLKLIYLAQIFRNTIKSENLSSSWELVPCQDDVSPLVVIRATDLWVNALGEEARSVLYSQLRNCVEALENEHILTSCVNSQAFGTQKTFPFLRLVLKSTMDVPLVTQLAKSVVNVLSSNNKLSFG